MLSAGWPPEPGGAGIVAARALGTFVVLLVPSTLMGGTLPMLAKELVSGDGPAGSRVGLLYGLNAPQVGNTTGACQPLDRRRTPARDLCSGHKEPGGRRAGWAALLPPGS